MFTDSHRAITPLPMRPALFVGLVLSLVGCPDNITPAPRAGYTSAAPVLECTTNLDGQLDADEVATAFGLEISYFITPDGENRTVDTAGVVGDDGVLRWDLGEDRASDQVTTVTPAELEDQWFAASFPTGEVVLPLDGAGRTVGIYRRTDEAFWLLGSASTAENPTEGKTLLVYDSPVALFRFPMHVGDSWNETSTITNGTLQGLPFAGTHTYQIAVEAAGELTLPQLIFTQALQIKTRFEVKPIIGDPTWVRQTQWVFECFGEVARATSKLNEPDPDFTDAVEVRRFGQNLLVE